MRLAALLLLALSSAALPAQALWPQPSSAQTGSAVLRVDASALSIQLPANAPADVQAAVDRTLAYIRSDRLLPLGLGKGRGSERAGAVNAAKVLSKVVVNLGSASASAASNGTGNAAGTLASDPALQPPAAVAGLVTPDDRTNSSARRPAANQITFHRRQDATADAARILTPADRGHGDPAPGAQIQAGQQQQQQSQPVDDYTPRGIFAEILQQPENYDEAYTLDIPADGSAATLSANSSLGVLRGLTTLQQLVYLLPSNNTQGQATAAAPKLTPDSNITATSTTPDSTLYIYGVPLRISDRPAFPYRGLLLDTARNFYSVASLKRTLDSMELVKLNQFHWHVVDSQSFPLSLPGDYGRLSEQGAYSASMVYSQAEVKELVEYAGQRGISVNVEIDMPGHIYAGARAFTGTPDELLVCPDHQPDWWNWSNEPPSGQIKLGNAAADAYIQGLLNATATIFPGPLFSHGGDEVNLKCYNASAKADLDAPLLKPFVEKVQTTLKSLRKRPMVWEEMAIDFPETGKALQPGTIVETWTSSANVRAVLLSNPEVKLIHAPYDYFYLDCGRGGWTTGATGASWCPHTSWSHAYTFDPLNGTQGIAAGAARVLGGESALWSEQSDETQVDSLLWPRAASAAEIYWTGANYTTTDGQVLARNVSEAQGRLNDVRFRLVQRGVQAMPAQPLYCALDPSQCRFPS